MAVQNGLEDTDYKRRPRLNGNSSSRHMMTEWKKLIIIKRIP